MTKCIIVDDERPARDLIRLHLSGLQDFELVETFDNALDAFNFLQRAEVDLIFLDIEMPRVSGLELIKSLKVCPKIILTTAFREYAVEAFELDVLDYLIKPVTQERFMKAISKFTYYNKVLPEKTNIPNSFDNAYIFLKNYTCSHVVVIIHTKQPLLTTNKYLHIRLMCVVSYTTMQGTYNMSGIIYCYRKSTMN
jgi:DNA-binding LytR/AlgR family response regulator